MTQDQTDKQPITLGELIDALEKCKPESGVQFDFCGMTPDGVDSYRGYYDHLAIGHKDEGAVTAGELLAELRAAVGKVFEGYKGGDFRMDRDTPMWVANYGRSGSTAVVGVRELSWGSVIIVTGYCEDWNGGMERARRVLFHGLGFGNV